MADAAQKMLEISEWIDDLHVGERGDDERGYEVHYMLDPGDGLCSTFVGPTSEGNARFVVAACNSHLALVGHLEMLLRIMDETRPEAFATGVTGEGSNVDEGEGLALRRMSEARELLASLAKKEGA